METRRRKKMRLIEEEIQSREEAYCPTREEQLMVQAMSNHLILKEVFLNLPRSTLLTCSLVSRKWNVVARRITRDRSRCPAVVYLDNYQCLRSFKKLLQSSSNLPYNGLIFRLTRHKDRCSEENGKELRKLDSIPWSRIRIKTVAVIDEKFNSWCSHSMHSLRCQSVLMLHHLWPRIAGNVEHLSIRSISFALKFQTEDGVSVCPNVKTIEWPSADIDEPYFESLFHSAPKLMELTSDVSQYSLPLVMREKKSFIVKKLRVFNAQDWTVVDFAKERPRLKKISFSHCHYTGEFSPTILSQVLEGLLSNSLRELKMNYPEMLFWYRICKRPLFNLRHLTVTYSNQYDDRYGFQHMSFSRVFPNLKSITFQPGCKPCRPPTSIQTEYLEIFGENNSSAGSHGNAALAPAPSVTRLEYWNSGGFYDRIHNYVEPNLIRALALNFPNISYFVMGGNAWNLNLELIFTTVWTVWARLERIKFVSTDTEMLSLLEASIIGISREELAIWKVMPGVNIRLMQFAPSRPSIRDCAHLKLFNVLVPQRYSVLGLDYYPSYVRVGGPAPDLKDLFPWATPLAFDRLKGLEVEITVYKPR